MRGIATPPSRKLTDIMGVITWAQARITQPRVFWALSFGHLVNDVFMSMGGVVLVFLSGTVLPMNAAQIGLAVSGRQIAGALSQPFFGSIGDKTGGRWMAAGGVAWVVFFQTLSVLMAFSGNVWLMVIPFVLAALGSGAFHPVGVSHASEVDPANQSRNMAVFFLFGQLGLGLGPTLAGLLLSGAKGLANPTFSSVTPLYLVALMAFPFIGWMARAIPTVRSGFVKRASKGGSLLTWKQVALPLTIAAIFVMLRTAAQQGSANFIAVLMQERGYDPEIYGLVTGLYWLGSAFMGVQWGRWADRFGMRPILIASIVLGAPTLIIFPYVDGLMAAVVAVLSGALLSGTHPQIVLLLQRLMPAGRGLAGGIALGMIFVAGALGSAVYGILADGPASLGGDAAVMAVSWQGIGLSATFAVSGLVALASGLLLFVIPRWAFEKR